MSESAISEIYGANRGLPWAFNVSPEVGQLVCGKDGINLQNLYLLANELDIDQMYDALEAREIQSSWEQASIAHQRELSARR
jgi:hypothetical protein